MAIVLLTSSQKKCKKKKQKSREMITMEWNHKFEHECNIGNNIYKLAVVDKFYNPLAQRSDVNLATEK